jgi:hypothetical protein
VWILKGGIKNNTMDVWTENLTFWGAGWEVRAENLAL